ncbi:cupin domain-containing protein [Flocculibacter collagenilyticus]|uniref:cupin domain-containing protein n=1 Tax=Flocculibacter collagenilyticus TaxID=2744479 RepID=UPI0018F41F5A|nr:cupin domain-containing protein [Flocculibacter collagenilyticus]
MAGSYPEQIKTLPLYDGRFDAYKLAANACDVLFASYPSGTKIPEHTHDTDNYGVITKGKLNLIMDDEVHEFNVGDWYFVPAHKPHAAFFDEETDEIEFWFKK